MFSKRHKPTYSKNSWIPNQKKIHMKTPHNYLSTLPEKLKTNKMHGERENDTLPTGGKQFEW